MSEHPEQNSTPAADSAPEAQGTAAGSEVEVLQARLAQAEAAAQSAKDAQLRALADLDNTRRRLERDAQASLKYGAEKLLGELLGVCDSLELGLKAAGDADGPSKALAEGMQLTYRQLMSVLEKHGVRQIDPAGQPFNPEFHQAMTMVESADVAPNHVLSVMQRGYVLHERLLRPAMVVVAKAPAA